MGTTIDQIWTGKTRAAHRALSSGSRFGPDPQITILARGTGQAAHQRPDTRPHSITALIGKSLLLQGRQPHKGRDGRGSPAHGAKPCRNCPIPSSSF